MSSIGATPGNQNDNKETNQNGTGNTTDAGNNDALGNHPNANAPADKSGDEATANADKQRLAAESKAAEDAKAHAAAKTEADDKSKKETEPAGEEKWPRSGADWEKFRAKRKQEREQLEKEIKTRDENIAALQGQIREAKEASEKAGEVPPQAKGEIERLQKLVDEMSSRIRRMDVTQEPRFEAHFKSRIDDEISVAKQILGEEKGKAFEEIVNIPDHPSLREYKRGKMDDLLSELGPYESGAISNVTTSLLKIERERQGEIAKEKQHAETLKLESESKQKTTAKQNEVMREKLFGEAVSSAKDAKTGLAVYQEREGDAEWNKGVEQRTAAAKRLLFGGKDVKPEEVARAALHAAAFPAILEAYQADRKRWDTEIATLQEQVKKMTAAQPGKGGALSKPQSDEAGKTGSSVKDGMNPFEASKAFAQDMMAARNAE